MQTSSGRRRALGVLSLLSSLIAVYALPPTVALKPLVATPEGLRLEWAASSPELEFTVEARPTLDAGGWSPLPGPVWPQRPTQFTDPGASAASQFYRVVGTPIVGERGRIISTTLVTNLSQFQIQLIFTFGGIPVTPQSAVKVYKIIYETVDAQGLRTQASGSLSLPDNRPTALPLVSYQHGTILEREDVPSRLNFEGYIGVAMATSGYAAVLPDYLGLGDSPGVHPYHHAKSEATCVVDLLRAARRYCASNTVALNGKLFLTGYSHGGHATLAAMRELEALHTDEFVLTACAPGAGAYDLSGVTADDFLSARPKPNPYYLPYVIHAYQDVYGWADSFSDLWVEPYATLIPPLFDGQHGAGEINAQVPANPVQMLQPTVLESFRTNAADDPLRANLRDNDLIHWTPKAPLRLYHCSGDLDVLPVNTAAALAAFQSRGATQVQALDPLPGAVHGDCAEPALLAAKAWFDTLK